MTVSSPIDARFAVSSWSLHRTLGRTYPYGPGSSDYVACETPYGEGTCELLDVPAQLKTKSIDRLEICSFHLPSLSESYFNELRGALNDAGVTLQTLLIEDGDPSNYVTAQRDVEWMLKWVHIAERLGAERARVIAGKQKPNEVTLASCIKTLDWLHAHTEGVNVRIVTENWFSLLASSGQVLHVLDALGGRIGLNGDLGNWKRPAKYDGLSKIMGRAEICHAKASFGPDGMDSEDYGRCISISENAGYKGPYTLIYAGDYLPEWDGILVEKAFIEDLLQKQASVSDPTSEKIHSVISTREPSGVRPTASK